MNPMCSIALSGFFAVSCISSPQNIEAEYVDPAIYTSLSCEQLDEEQRRLALMLSDTSDYQRETRQDEQSAMWASILTGLPIYEGSMGDVTPIIALLKGRLHAVEKVAASKNCTFEILNIDDALAED